MTKVERATKRSPDDRETVGEVHFDYIKSNFFRVVHADGIFGGLTPNGLIHMDVWNQRFPIPKQSVHAVTPDGKLGEELRDKRTTRDAIAVREVEVGIVLDANVARELISWLEEKLNALDQAKNNL